MKLWSTANGLQAQKQTTKQDTELQNRIEIAYKGLKSLPQKLTEYDDALVSQTIHQIKILDGDTLKIQFVDEAEVRQQMPKRVYHMVSISKKIVAKEEFNRSKSWTIYLILLYL